MSAKYIYIANQLRDFLTNSTSQSIKLPTEMELCTKYSVSRQTIRKALSVLTDEQLIVKRQGSGSYSSNVGVKARANTVALIISSDSDYIYPRLISEIKSHLQTSGYSLTVYVTNNNINIERKILSSLSSDNVCGIICEPCQNNIPTSNDDIFNYLHSKGISILFIGYSYKNLSHLPSVHYDDYNAAMILCQHLINNGHRKIGTILQNDKLSGINRFHGYATALRINNIEIPVDSTFWINSKMIANLQKNQDSDFLADIISKRSKSCSAFICQNDEVSYWFIKELSKNEIMVPEDISVVAFTNTYLNDLSDTPATTVSALPSEFNNTVARKIVSLIQGHATSDSTIQLNLVERKSVRKL